MDDNNNNNSSSESKQGKQPVMRSLARVMEWELNPRRGVYRDMEELKESLRRVGLQDPIHVWERTEGDLLLKGHRRTRAMKGLHWDDCLQFVHHFETEAEAFKFLLEDTGHTVPLDAEEKIVAVENGVKLGMTTADLAPMLGVKEERVQLWFDLGKDLPQVARSALAKGDLSVNTAELLLGIVNEKDRRAAALAIMKDPETGEPMAFGQARSYIQARYLLPEKWHAAWLELSRKLAKKKRIIDGYHYVEWAQRMDYVLGDSGQPRSEFELGEAYYPKDAEGRNWEQVAVGLQVPVYVCAAPRHAEGFVTLVNAQMMREAVNLGKEQAAAGDDEGEDSNQDEGLAKTIAEKAAFALKQRIAEFRDFYAKHPECSAADFQRRFGLSFAAADILLKTLKEDTDADDKDPVAAGFIEGEDHSDALAASQADEEHLRVWLKTWLGAIYEKLVSNPTDAMTKGPWVPLYGFLAHLTTVPAAGALEAWRGIATEEEALKFMHDDQKQRAPLRLALLFLLCAECDASDEPERVIREVAAALGLDAEALDRAVAEAAG